MPPCPTVAVVGGGASGTLTAVHLLQRLRGTSKRARILLIDRDARHGVGVAYSTTDATHLLNSPLARMSAVAGDPDHLRRWVARARGAVPDPGEFLPRMMFGRYLRETLAAAEWAVPDCRMRRITAEVRRLRPVGAGFRLTLSDGASIAADFVVLATGNPSSHGLPVLGSSGRFIEDPWAPGALDRILALPAAADPVVIVGTGLTMVDLALSLTSRGGGPPVTAVSRHGLLPRPHPDPLPPPRPAPLPPGRPDLGGLLRTVRAAVAADPAAWAGVVDGLRPLVPQLWAGLTETDRRRFLALVARTWEVHRHRMPPPVAGAIAQARHTGKLTVVQGEVIEAYPHTDRVEVLIRRQGGVIRASASLLINATGPDGDLRASTNPLLRTLCADGHARPDPLRLGLDADPGGRLRAADGRIAHRLVTLGPPLRGIRYETTAVPEIRDQAAALAADLAAALAAPTPRSALAAQA